MGKIDPSALWDFADSLKSQGNSQKSQVRQAVVSRVDNDCVWVRVYGSDIETPTVTTSAEVKPGDTVTVEWRNNSLHILGNTSEPATSSSRVKTM